MKIIANPIKKEQVLGKAIEVKHWFGTTIREEIEHSTINTFEYEITELSKELLMFVEAKNMKHKGYKMTDLNENILKASKGIIDHCTYIGDGYYILDYTRNSLKFTPYNLNMRVPLPKQDNSDYIRQKLTELEDEIRYVIKLCNSDR